MKVDGRHYRTIWLADDGWSVEIIDQTRLPHDFAAMRLTTLAEAAEAIRAMRVRGAPLIGATAAYGLCLALRADPSDEALDRARESLHATRPTAVNLRWALDDMRDASAQPPARGAGRRRLRASRRDLRRRRRGLRRHRQPRPAAHPARRERAGQRAAGRTS